MINSKTILFISFLILLFVDLFFIYLMYFKNVYIGNKTTLILLLGTASTSLSVVTTLVSKN
ncbi:hypothetical protein [Oceanivirga salmonicida]|uniref:hypothetical protein n=1 Tax=Oceanivirga salmonicida TaxID=1769291 RepID=UPI000833C044|nr:hypothetical protein [Oceanivirga salmonicida]